MFKKKPDDSKPESSFERVVSIPNIENLVFSFLQIKDWRSAARIAQGFYQINKNELMWRERYQQDFGPIIFETDYNLQYYAMYLYNLANNPRPDIAKYYSKKLNSFIEEVNKKTSKQGDRKDDDKAKPWTAFFIMFLHFKTVINIPDYEKYQKSAVSNNDYRAVQLLVNRQEGPFSTDQQHQYLTCLKDAYSKGYTEAALEIGYCYGRYAEGNKDKIEQAKFWFLKYLETHDDSTVAVAFSTLFWNPQLVEDSDSDVEENEPAEENNLIDEENEVAEPDHDPIAQNAGDDEINDNEEDLESDDENSLEGLQQELSTESSDKKQDAINTLQAHFEKFPSGGVAFVIAGLYVNKSHPNFIQARAWFNKAVNLKNGKALQHLAFVNYSGIPADRISLLEKSFEMGESSSADLIAQFYRNEANFDESIRWLKKGFLAGCDCADQVSKQFREEKGWQANSNQVCWIQAAAQCNDIRSIWALLENINENQGCNFATCALEIMSKLGVLNLSEQESKALKIVATKLNWEILEKYQTALKQEGLLEPYIDDLFIAWKKEMEPKKDTGLSAGK